MPTPIKNPRSAALVGLTMSASDSEFALAWEAKFPSHGQMDAPVSFGSTGTTKSTPNSPITGDAKQKVEAMRAFLDITLKLQGQGHSYQESWIIAGSTEPGKTYYETWQHGAAEEKWV